MRSVGWTILSALTVDDLYVTTLPHVSIDWSISERSAQGQVFHIKRRAKAAALLKGRSSTANSGTKAAVSPGMNRCGSFPLFSAPYSLFRIWKDLKRSEMIPGAPKWRWGEWIWLTGPSGLHRIWTQGLNTSSIKVLISSEVGKSLSPLTPTVWNTYIYDLSELAQCLISYWRECKKNIPYIPFGWHVHYIRSMPWFGVHVKL